MPILSTRRVSTVPALPPVSKRRMRYEQDAEYRENAKFQSRRAYRRRKGMEITTCLHSLGFLDEVATVQTCRLPDGSTRELRVLTVPTTAAMLQKLYQTLWRWIDNGLIPRPVLESQSGARPCVVYHVEEVRALLKLVGEHEKEVRYLRKDHVTVIERIEQRFMAIRTTLGIQR